MNDKFLIGVVLGMLGGAVIVTNSQKARTAVKDGQNEIMKKVQEIKPKTNGKKSK